MKAGLHPKYNEATVTCACGNTFVTRSTKNALRTDLCNVCHPFYTGEQRIIDSAGQVERFMKRMAVVAEAGTRPSKRQARLSQRATERTAQETRAAEAAGDDGLDVADAPLQPAAAEAGVPTAEAGSRA